MVASIPVAVFARAPVAGQVKTRLAAALGHERAVELHLAFLEDVLAVATADIRLDVTLWVAGDPESPALRAVAPSVPRRAQPELPLGGRIAAALAEAVASSGRGLVLGSDAPTLPPSFLAAAAETLDRPDGPDAVVGPSADGGYYLLGARCDVHALVRDVRWSTADVLADTERAAAQGRMRLSRLPPWYDIDTPRDLRCLAAHLAIAPQAAPATARALARLRRSVDVPSAPG